MKFSTRFKWRPEFICRCPSSGGLYVLPLRMSSCVQIGPLHNSRPIQVRWSSVRSLSAQANSKKAYIALGSNVGDRIGNIERACRALDNEGLRVTRTSSLYETAPMYVEDQDTFINGVCETDVPTNIEPLDLLAKVKGIENKLGRQKTIDKGPRNIDLDILLHGNTEFHNQELSVPHSLMLEREFVLRPLCDLIPQEYHPSKPGTSYAAHLSNLPKSKPPISTITPLSAKSSLKALVATRKTQLMAIINLTPDSFSDGAIHSSAPDVLLPLIQSHLEAGATIIDIGGQSTAPRAPEVSVDEELSRVIPAIKLIRSRPEYFSLLISIDTYRASVARAAIEAGADMVNDISGGTMDSRMLPTVADLGCTYVMMHMRGTPADMARRTLYSDGLIPTIAEELRARIAAAEKAGVRRWRMVLDPGIGFAKNMAQNLELLRKLGELRRADGLRGLPWLVGASRKGFVGKITEVKEASQRTWGTATAVAASIQGGADIVRVHDVEEMGKVAKMADAIWRVEDSDDGEGSVQFHV